ncbi:MAG: non-homologous end-joining DNA ligase [Parachlamydiaceae bacterium]
MNNKHQSIQEIFIIEGKKIQFTHLDKILFPKSGIKKVELFEYYLNIAPTILPHYRNRPLTMVRFPKGIDNKGFFQKNIFHTHPNWLEFVEVKKQSGTLKQILVNHPATLAYLTNQECIEMHLALSRADKIDFPDRVIFDLDPPPDNDFAKIRWAARQLKASIDQFHLISFIQTTGSRGVHIVIPIDRTHDFTYVHSFAKKLAYELADQFPDQLTIAQRKQKRGSRVFVDYSRNSYGQGAIGPYSLRAKEGAPIATPLYWEELDDENLNAQSYHLGNIFQRLKKEKDPWQGIHSIQQTLP